MDGRRTVDELWRAVVDPARGRRADAGRDHPPASQLHAADMMQCDIPPDAAELFERHAAMRASKLRRRYSNPISIKASAAGPGPVSRRARLAICAAVVRLDRRATVVRRVLPALVLVGMHWGDLTENIADRVLATENLDSHRLRLPGAQGFSRTRPRLRRQAYGGEVHEFGLMFLVFAPVPYVDASARRRFRSKWQRAWWARPA